MRQILAPVLSNTEILPAVHLLWLEAPEIAASAQPGQFVMVRTGEGYDPLLRRPFSIHRVSPLSSPTKLALLFEVVGRGTNWLAQREQGDMIDLLGPLGNGFEVHFYKLLLVAGGIGIAPLAFLAEKAASEGRHVTMLSGAKTADRAYPLDRLTPGVLAIEFVITEDGSLGREGMVTEYLSDFDGWADQIFACGPLSMYETMARIDWLSNRPVQVSMEARMGCGFGVCYGCAIETRSGLRLVCKDGPIFELNDIIW